MYILDPTLDEESSKSLVGKIEDLISKQGASVENTETWGRRRLAYRIKGHWEGNYVLSQLKASPDTVGEMERRLRNTDGVLRFLTVRIDEQQAKAERRRARLDEKERARRDRKRASSSDSDTSGSGSGSESEPKSEGGAHAAPEPSSVSGQDRPQTHLEETSS
jgi:small subunit ribosomal protein S6